MSKAPDVYSAEPIPASAEEEIRALLESADLFRYNADSGAAAARLEREFAHMLGVPFALAVSSCSSALFLSLKALGLKPGARVLIPAFTFAAVPSAVVHAGCVPVLCNVGENYRLLIDEFEARLDDDIDAVMISHMRGHTSDMDDILSLCTARSIPVVEDAAHSLGAKWDGKPIGTMGAIGCYSFQSYKLVNGGEGGMLITRDPDLIARAIIMSGAYEHNWRKHEIVSDRFAFWQNKLPLYNMRINNLSAAVVRAQLAEVPRRVRDGKAGHDLIAGILNASPWLDVPAPLAKEERAPDSIQFNLVGFDTDEEAIAFQTAAKGRGIAAQMFGLSEDNARAFWNWEFTGNQQTDLEPTRQVLMRACDVRLSTRLDREGLEYIANGLVQAAEDVKGAVKRRVA